MSKFFGQGAPLLHRKISLPSLLSRQVIKATPDGGGEFSMVQVFFAWWQYFWSARLDRASTLPYNPPNSGTLASFAVLDLKLTVGRDSRIRSIAFSTGLCRQARAHGQTKTVSGQAKNNLLKRETSPYVTSAVISLQTVLSALPRSIFFLILRLRHHSRVKRITFGVCVPRYSSLC